MRCILIGCLFFVFTAFFTVSPVTSTAEVLPQNDADRIFSGNVYGILRGTSSENSLTGCYAFVTNQPVVSVSEDYPSAVFSNRGWVVVPKPDTSVCAAGVDGDGSYIINSIPVAAAGSRYNVVIGADGMEPVIIDSALILPGAVMALQVDVLLEATSSAYIVEAGQASAAVVTNAFRHTLGTSGQTEPKPADTDLLVSTDADDALTLRIYATREGLVGGTTANGHVIRERDHFVALPSTKVLCSKGGYEYEVKLEHNGYTETAPVWDIGPWNIHDNYWEPDEERLIYQYLKNGGQHGELGQGLPESQAAYEDDFNSGRDEFGRRVVNPAGIDLADGTFWDGLNLSDNAWIKVKYLWMDGDSEDSDACFIETAGRQDDF